ncbi:MAG: SDR family NAD(P)-dependent oxidoreductase [Acidobacteria bacterium]|nr:SDR family NAD(P)-dependent oxidoreductase [Acidobacteriota bacterium]
MNLDQQVVLITGANGGLGTSVTEAFLEAGAAVIGVSRKIAQSDFPRPSFIALPAELSSAEAAGGLVETAIQRCGKIDALVHLVGGFAGGKSIAETDDASWDRMMDLNLRSAFLVIRAVVPRMRAAGSGRIVAIGSRTAIDPQPLLGAYSASKAALVSLIRTLALENKDLGITANVILPGAMDTPANRAADPTADFSRWIAPQRVAALAVFLVSNAGAQISGAAIPVYGRDV